MSIKIVKKNMNFIKAGTVYLSMLVLGLSITITGPCLLDLERLVNTDAHHIAFLYTSRSLGFFVGALLGGVVLDQGPSRMLVMMVCNFFVTVSLFGIPWSRSLETLLGFAALNGLSLGAIETGSNVIIIQLWDSGPALQGLYFAFGLGNFVSPLLAAPFLEDQTKLQDLSHTNNYSSNASRNFSGDTFYPGIPTVTYPFSIIAIFALLVTILFFVIFLISPYEDNGSQIEEEVNSNESHLFICSTVLLNFFFFFFLIGTEFGIGQNLASYAVTGKLHETPAAASYMTSAYWGAFMIMKFVAIFLSIKFSNMVLVLTDIGIISVAGAMLLFCMPNEGVLWTVAVLCGSGLASVYASQLGWLADYVQITNKISAVMTASCAAGEMAIPFTITYFMETVPEMLAYIIPSSCVISTVLLLIFYVVIKKSKKKGACKQTEC